MHFPVPLPDRRLLYNCPVSLYILLLIGPISVSYTHLDVYKRQDYDTEHLIKLLQDLKARYPHLQIILEPGSAFTWQTGVLTSEVVDIVESLGIKTAILNVSFTCHMPDCLEMPYQPAVRGAEMGNEGEFIYRLGGNSCLSGDYTVSYTHLK